MIIKLADVHTVLSGRLGEKTASLPNLCESVAHLLRGWVPQRTTLSELESQLENILFSSFYEAYGPQMLMQCPDGKWRRLKMEGISILADDLMGVLFRSMSINQTFYTMLYEYALHRASPNAMRVLMERYKEQLTDDERNVLLRVIKETSV